MGKLGSGGIKYSPSRLKRFTAPFDLDTEPRGLTSETFAEKAVRNRALRRLIRADESTR